jgi:hypothetical protein
MTNAMVRRRVAVFVELFARKLVLIVRLPVEDVVTIYQYLTQAA